MCTLVESEEDYVKSFMLSSFAFDGELKSFWCAHLHCPTSVTCRHSTHKNQRNAYASCFCRRNIFLLSVYEVAHSAYPCVRCFYTLREFLKHFHPLFQVFHKMRQSQILIAFQERIPCGISWNNCCVLHFFELYMYCQSQMLLNSMMMKQTKIRRQDTQVDSFH
jgi:hypothetical protein